jgi:ABC-type uncharacterized transport system YnjBCD ATPase subunit
MSAIEFRSVDKIYRGRRVIDALSFIIEAGERIVLFGPSGCGKSTTLLLIAGLVEPDAGEIRIDGKVVSTARRIHVAPQSRGVGMVFQDLALWPHMSVAENIGFGLRARRVPSSECRQRISDIANLVGLGDYLDVRPGELSGGEQQRVALALAPWSLGFSSWTSRFRVSMTRSATDCAKKSCACMPSLALRSSMSRTAARKQRKWVREQSSLVEAARHRLPNGLGLARFASRGRSRLPFRRFTVQALRSTRFAEVIAHGRKVLQNLGE